MQRLLHLTIAVGTVAASLSAGTIQTQINLSASNVTAPGWSENNYDNYLFGGVTNGSNKPSPGTNYTFKSSTNSIPSNTLTDNSASALAQDSAGVTFNLLNDGCIGGCTAPGNKTANLWAAPYNTASSTLTASVGIFDVTDVWLVLNNLWGASGANDTTVILDFGDSATVTNANTLTLALNNSSKSASNTGQIGSSIRPTSNGTCGACSGFATGSLQSSTAFGSTTVDTNQIYSFAYNGTSFATDSAWGGSSTTGNVVLNDQGIILPGTYANQYLVDIRIVENHGSPNGSDTTLAAITVDSVGVVPEPSSIWLLLAGSVVFGAFALRRRRTA